MALVVVNEPQNISLSKNVIYYSLRNGLLPGRGVQAAYITPATKMFNGDELVLNWTDGDGAVSTLTFLAVANPVTDTEIQDDSTADTFLEWLQIVSDKIQAHPQVAPFFRTFIGNDDPIYTITIEALEIDDTWVVAFDASGVAVPSVSTSQDLTIQEVALPDNYKIHLEVFFERTYLAGDWVRVAQCVAIPHDRNNVSFQINEILHSELKKSYASAPIPATDVSAPYIADNLRRYYVRYTEESGTDPTKEVWTVERVKTLFCGGIDQDDFVTNDFFTGLTDVNSLLTNFPDKRIVSPSQPNYISWFNYTGSEQTIDLKVVMYDESNTATTIYKYTASPLVVADQETATIPIGYNQLELADEGIDIIYYTVQVTYQLDHHTTLSQMRTFYVDHSYQEFERHILYLNAFCMPEVIRCIGEMSTALQVIREESAKILPPDYTVTAEEIIQHNEEYEVEYTYRTGFLTINEKEALQEMLIYNDLFEVLSSGYLALYITDKNFNIANRDRENRVTLEFNAKPRLKKKISNEDLLLAPSAWTTPSEGNWTTPDGDSWIFN